MVKEKCPFCQNEVPDGAIVCGNCGAEKGVSTDDKGRVLQRTEVKAEYETMVFALKIFAGIGALGLILATGLFGLNARVVGIVALGISGIIAFFLFLWIMGSSNYDKMTEQWYRKK